MGDKTIWDVTDGCAIRRMALAWHERSDHAKDGSRFRSLICNCERIAERAYMIGWRDE